jgi:hypothetical protein
MSQATRISRYGIVHAHMTWNITPLGGNNEGVPYTVRSCESFDYGLGTKYAAIGGNQFRPVTVSLVGSDPKWSAELSMAEVREIRAFIGTGWASIPLKFEITWQQIGTSNPAFTDEFFDCFFGDDGATSKYGADIVKSKVGSMCSDIREDGRDAFDPSNPAG